MRERGRERERLREHGMEITRDTQVFKKSDFYPERQIFKKKISRVSRTEVKKRRKERERLREHGMEIARER